MHDLYNLQPKPLGFLGFWYQLTQMITNDNWVYYKSKFSETKNTIIIRRHPKHSIFILLCLYVPETITIIYMEKLKKKY